SRDWSSDVCSSDLFAFNYRGTRHRGQQDTTQCVAQSVTEATLKRLQSDLGMGFGYFVNLNVTRCQKFINCTLHRCPLVPLLLRVKFHDQVFVDLRKEIRALRSGLERAFH